eukprot:5954333-Amphidinium_carterae.1
MPTGAALRLTLFRCCVIDSKSAGSSSRANVRVGAGGKKTLNSMCMKPSASVVSAMSAIVSAVPALAWSCDATSPPRMNSHLVAITPSQSTTKYCGNRFLSVLLLPRLQSVKVLVSLRVLIISFASWSCFSGFALDKGCTRVDLNLCELPLKRSSSGLPVRIWIRRLGSHKHRSPPRCTEFGVVWQMFTRNAQWPLIPALVL